VTNITTVPSNPNSGPAVIGNVGALEQMSFTAIGDTTNLAARLCGACCGSDRVRSSSQELPK
jgi:class 3 adenylate cyclase